ncbi:MAG: hypothetical protein H0U41_02435 [Actinobacteria bacterium]|nr:hypothetical protein [Actinomycetota bacterium]
MGQLASDIGRRIIAVAVLLLAAFILFKVVIGAVAAVVWMVVAVVALVAVVWALAALR